ncbi:MAG: aldehyde ferredoxin oxidoreductase N-terminal domain-containing protein [Thermincola sp.]|jgi:aldehyde:ferredoxin oxidoreductase|nr:aldehyde ferredoxin oxidoreductase N-terminal domain-containing protein [Thermincola sp.]MDT3704620.1 aldehyde ferredoxin oxidoreductase N-terminal domain-containing protein [Thermincola sp.]
MRYAETGYDLEVDLSRGNIERMETDQELTKLHLGGNGTAARLIWDRVPPEVDAFSPDNLLIFSTGLLVGTPVPACNRTMVDTISPQTNLFSHSIFGGYFGPELKHAGYDKIVIRGKAPDLVYLWIHNDRMELRDASHLKGKGAQETAEIIKKELNDSNIQVAAIGLAGENRLFMASIEHSNASASRGVGAVMGDKRLKAIAVRGTKDFNVASPEELYKLCLTHSQEIHASPFNGDLMAIEWNDEFHHDNFAWGNARTRRRGYWSQELEDRWKDYTLKIRDRLQGCYNCPKNCHLVVKPPGRQRYMLKCYGKGTWHMAAFKEVDFTFDILALSQEYGVDSYAAPQTIAFAIELYEAGILTDKDLPDFPADSGDRFYYLLEKLVRREGIGDVLANGVYHAARQIGNGAEVYDHNTMKKFEQLPLKLGKVNYPYFLMYCTSDKMAINQTEGSFPQDALRDPEERKKFVDEWISAPERFRRFYMEWEPRTNPSVEASVNICDWNETMHYIDDATGLCAFCSSFRGQFGGGAAYHIYNIPHFINVAAGMEMDADDLWQVARRNKNLVRAINISRGMRRADEKPPEDHWKVREPDKEKELLDEYYKFKGWTNDGIPSKATLDKLGLGFVAEEFIKRGILTGSEDNCYTEISCYSEVNKKDQFLSVRKAEGYTLTEALSKKKVQ